MHKTEQSQKLAHKCHSNDFIKAYRISYANAIFMRQTSHQHRLTLSSKLYFTFDFYLKQTREEYILFMLAFIGNIK